MDHLAALVAFAFVSSVTPGPNDVLLWASGATFGFARTVPHVLGTAVGLAAMVLAVAAGLGVLIEAIAGLALAMKIAGSVYLLYLAWKIAGTGAMTQTTVARPLNLSQAAAFQVINPKAWIFALGAVTTFRPSGLPILAGTLLVAVTMIVVIIPSAGAWVVAGSALNRLLTRGRTRRIVGLGLAAAVAATVLLVWL